MYEATTDETDQLMPLWNLDLKIYERHWTIDICERFKRFDVYQMLEAVNHEMTIEKDTQHLIEIEKEIWKRVFEKFIEQSMQVNSVSEDKFYLILKNKMKKSDIAQIYEKYLWAKCSKTKYYQNIKAWMHPLEALKPIPKETRYRPNKIKSERFADELKRYIEYEWPKVSKSRFYQRLYQWRNKEEAIKLDFWIHYTKKRNVKKETYQRPKKTPIEKKADDSDKREIKITYTKEEAEVMKKTYEDMIEEVENQILYADVGEISKLNEKLNNLVQEYQTFISYNTNTNESL